MYRSHSPIIPDAPEETPGTQRTGHMTTSSWTVSAKYAWEHYQAQRRLHGKALPKEDPSEQAEDMA